MSNKKPNQLHRNLMGVCGMNPWAGYDSSSRVQMMASHLSQALVINGGTERFCQTGMEREYGRYTFSVKMPVDAEIIRVIERYPHKIGVDAIAMNPQTVVIYEDVNTKEIGMLNITGYCSYHQYFGFEYKGQSALHDVRSGAFIPKDTVLLDSPAITEDGGYKFGAECNIAYMAHPAVSEDGILISRDVLPRFAFKTYEERTVEWGSKRFALNLYGDAEHYKPFPDIGDRVREDGILMCHRPYSEELGVVEQSIYDVMEPNVFFDKMTYAGGAGGRIVDIKIQHDNTHSQPAMLGGMDQQPEKYDIARRQFYQSIVSEYQRLKRDRGDSLRLSKEFHRLVVEALAVIDNDPTRLVKLYRQAKLDVWRVTFVIEYDIIPTDGFKLTGLHGNKGVICHVAEPHEMPIDEHGNRADIVMDGNAVINRMNIGQLYEQYINAASRDVRRKIILDLGLDLTNIPMNKGSTILLSQLQTMEKTNIDLIDRVWNYLLGYYGIVSPKMYVWFTSGEYDRPRIEHLASIIKKGIYLYVPPDNDPLWGDIVNEVEKQYRPVYGPVSYVGNSGQRVTTKKPVRIGSVYIIVLEKTGDDWTAVSSAKLQHFGVLSQVTNADKYSQPSRTNAIRALGESEVRIYVSYAGAQVTTEIMDRSNNPASHKQVLTSILNADKPTNIEMAVDRNVVPLGGSRPLSLVRHILETGGVRFIWKQHIPSYIGNPVPMVCPEPINDRRNGGDQRKDPTRQTA